MFIALLLHSYMQFYACNNNKTIANQAQKHLVGVLGTAGVGVEETNCTIDIFLPLRLKILNQILKVHFIVS